MKISRHRIAAVTLAFIFSFSLGNAAHARIKIEGVYVFGEADSADGKSCGVAYTSAVSAVEATLRANNIKLLSSSALDDISAYVNLNPVPTSDRSCALSWNVRFRIYGKKTAYGPNKVSLGGDLVLCKDSGVMTGPTYTLQTRVNDELRSATEKCISEVEKNHE